MGELRPCPVVDDLTTRQVKTGKWRALKPVVDNVVCTKCGICDLFCPDSVTNVDDDGLTIDYEYCKGCGICAEECPTHAITMVTEDRRLR